MAEPGKKRGCYLQRESKNSSVFLFSRTFQSLVLSEALRVATEQHDSRNLGRSSFTRDPLMRLDDKGKLSEFDSAFLGKCLFSFLLGVR